jgi:hypothetical protein
MEYLREQTAAARNHQLAFWDDPQFHYSVSLGTCLVRTRSVDEYYAVTYQHARVTDIYTARFSRVL